MRDSGRCTRHNTESIQAELDQHRAALLLTDHPERAAFLCAQIHTLLSAQHRYREYLRKRQSARKQRGREVEWT